MTTVISFPNNNPHTVARPCEFPRHGNRKKVLLLDQIRQTVTDFTEDEREVEFCDSFVLASYKIQEDPKAYAYCLIGRGLTNQDEVESMAHNRFVFDAVGLGIPVRYIESQPSGTDKAWCEDIAVSDLNAGHP